MAKLNYPIFFGEKHYINKSIPKGKWIQAGIPEKAREAFESFYVSSRILYSIPAVDTDFLIIEVMISKMSRQQKNFSDVLHSSMPYPVMLIQNYQDSWYKVSTVNSRPNSNNDRREVIENHYDSRWTTDEGIVRLLSQIANQIDCSTMKRSELVMQINYCLHEFNSTAKDEWYYSTNVKSNDGSVDRNNLKKELALALKQIQGLTEGTKYGFELDKEKENFAIMFENQCGEQLAVLDEVIEEFFYAVDNYREKKDSELSEYYEDDEEWEADSSWSMNYELEHADEKDEDLQIIYRIHADTISAAVDSLVDAIRKKGSFFADPEVKKRINRLQTVVDEMSRY